MAESLLGGSTKLGQVCFGGGWAKPKKYGFDGGPQPVLDQILEGQAQSWRVGVDLGQVQWRSKL